MRSLAFLIWGTSFASQAYGSEPLIGASVGVLSPLLDASVGLLNLGDDGSATKTVTITQGPGGSGVAPAPTTETTTVWASAKPALDLDIGVTVVVTVFPPGCTVSDGAIFLPFFTNKL